jgi:hypothetical protein
MTENTFQADGAVNLRRQGNAVLFDGHANVPEAAASQASDVAAVFNPDFGCGQRSRIRS